jgi:hypothetical protein
MPRTFFLLDGAVVSSADAAGSPAGADVSSVTGRTVGTAGGAAQLASKNKNTNRDMSRACGIIFTNLLI